MGSFTPVSVGAVTLATDLNQILNAGNGTANAQWQPTNGQATPVFPTFTGAPVADDDWVMCVLSGDTQPRAGLYYKQSTGYGGLRGGLGTSITAHLYANAGGWTIDEGLTVGGGLSVGGAGHVVGQFNADSHVYLGPADGSGGSWVHIRAGFGEFNISGDGGSMYAWPFAAGGFARNLSLMAWNGSTQVEGLFIDTAGNTRIGVVHHRAGASESGDVGISWSNSVNGQHPGVMCNFHEIFDRTPSVGLSTIDFSAASGLSTSDISTQGFNFFTTSGGGSGWVNAAYTANG